MGAGSLSDNSFLTHLATGRLIRSSGAPTHDLFTFASGGVRVDGWIAGGRVDDALASVRQQLTAQPDSKADAEPPSGGGRRRAGGGLDWLVPTADRDCVGLMLEGLGGTIDLIVSSALLSMGMMMLPPVIVSLPFKILLFVLVDGWYLIIGSLVGSFAK